MTCTYESINSLNYIFGTWKPYISSQHYHWPIFYITPTNVIKPHSSSPTLTSTYHILFILFSTSHLLNYLHTYLIHHYLTNHNYSWWLYSYIYHPLSQNVYSLLYPYINSHGDISLSFLFYVPFLNYHLFHSTYFSNLSNLYLFPCTCFFILTLQFHFPSLLPLSSLILITPTHIHTIVDLSLLLSNIHPSTYMCQFIMKIMEVRNNSKGYEEFNDETFFLNL